MARAEAAVNAPPHPRDDFAPLERVAPQAAAFEEALRRGRLHHAWLLWGPRGVGKARFALRAARRLLGARPDADYGPLGSAPDDPVSRLISARSHPDFLLLEREVPDGKPRRNIPVDEARRLPDFFSRSPALAPHRVAVIDAADDLNPNAANAVLKTLEEPPPRGVVLLVSHSPGRLLDTIRSRCRRLAFPPWPEADLADWLSRRGGAGEGDHAAAARGSPGRGLALAQGVRDDAAAAAGAVMDGLLRPDEPALVKLADGFRGGEGADRFAALVDGLGEAARARAADLLSADPAAAAAWADAWRCIERLPGEAEGLNLDRADAFWTALGVLRTAARTTSASSSSGP